MAIKLIDLEQLLFTLVIYNQDIISHLQKDIINGFYLMMKLLKQLPKNKYLCKQHISSFTKLMRIHDFDIRIYLYMDSNMY